MGWDDRLLEKSDTLTIPVRVKKQVRWLCLMIIKVNNYKLAENMGFIIKTTGIYMDNQCLEIEPAFWSNSTEVWAFYL